MKIKFINLLKMSFVAAVMATATSCSDDDGAAGTNPVDETSEKIFHIAMAVGSDGQSQTYIQGLTDLSTGDVSFNGFGFEVPSTRTARVYTSQDGKSVYNLDYGGGKIYKYTTTGGQSYTMESERNVQVAIGTANPRWTKVNEDTALMHNVITENIYDDAGNYVRTASTIRLVSIDLNTLQMGEIVEFEAPLNAEDAAAGNFVFRIDAPVVSNGKAYYGFAKRKWNTETGANVNATYTKVETLVVDFPSLTNPTIISTNVGGAAGATNGYRTPVSHFDENGDTYQIITVPNNTYDTHILRLRNGAYDESYDFNLSELLGKNTISNGWFYAGNGIGYVPFARSDEGALGDAVWSVARVDLYNNTAVELNLPSNLWLQQYQYSVVKDGKFYMAIAPLGQQGHIYMFDPASTSADGFTRGATIQTGADSYYIGIF